MSAAPTLGVQLPLQVCSETFAVLTRRFGWQPTDARDVVASLMDSLAVLGPTPATLTRAMKLVADHGIPIWDAQIAAVVANNGCDVLLTEDFQDGRIFSVADLGRKLRVVNPFLIANNEFVKTLGF
jgi:predicted nucleic acid-binding protein